MKQDNIPSLEAQYAQALQQEKAALLTLQAHEPGSDGSARAWQVWSEAIARTNEAWRELNSHTLSQHMRTWPGRRQSSAHGAVAPR